MLLRNILLTLGVLAILVGAVIAGYLWLRPSSQTASVSGGYVPGRTAVLVAAHPIPAGSLLREGDLVWRESDAKTPPPGSLARGQVTEAQFVGSVARSDLTAGQLVTGEALVSPTDRRFLSAVLSPGARAVTITVDAAQSASGLILPDDRVDLIVVQNQDASRPGSATARLPAAEILVSDVRVLAVDHDFARAAQASGAGGQAPAKGGGGIAGSQAPAQPKTITLELNDRDAERLFVAVQLGRVELSLRSLVKSPGEAAPTVGPVWSTDVSPLRLVSNAAPVLRAAPEAGQARRVAAARPIKPIRILRGSKGENQ